MRWPVWEGVLLGWGRCAAVLQQVLGERTASQAKHGRATVPSDPQVCHQLVWQVCWLAGEGVLLWWGVRKVVQLFHALFGCSQHGVGAWLRARFLRLAGVVCGCCVLCALCRITVPCLGKLWWGVVVVTAVYVGGFPIVHLCSISCFRCGVHAAPFAVCKGAAATCRLLLLPCGGYCCCRAASGICRRAGVHRWRC